MQEPWLRKLERFNALKSEALEQVLRELSSFIRERVPQEVISFDGQAARGTVNKYGNSKGIHLLSTWSSENGICLGQLTVAAVNPSYRDKILKKLF